MKASLVLSILMIVACGQKGDKKADDKAPVAGAAALPGATPSPTAEGSAAPKAGDLAEADNPACKVLTRTDAEAWVGHALEENKGRAMPVGYDCKYRTNQPFASVSVILFTTDGANAMTKQKAAKLFGETPVEIPGVGAQAVRSSDNNAVGVVVGDKLAYVLLVGNNKVTSEAAEKLAKAVASHM